eukprot:256002-Rhodomonas_salina.2
MASQTLHHMMTAWKKNTKSFERHTKLGTFNNVHLDTFQPIHYFDSAGDAPSEFVEDVTIQQLRVESNHTVPHDAKKIEELLRNTKRILCERCDEFKLSGERTQKTHSVSCSRYDVMGKDGSVMASVYVCRGHSHDLAAKINEAGVETPSCDTTLTFLDITKYKVEARIVTMEVHDVHTTVAVLTEHNLPTQMNTQSLMDVKIALYDSGGEGATGPHVQQLGTQFLVCKKAVLAAVETVAPGRMPYQFESIAFACMGSATESMFDSHKLKALCLMIPNIKNTKDQERIRKRFHIIESQKKMAQEFEKTVVGLLEKQITDESNWKDVKLEQAGVTGLRSSLKIRVVPHKASRDSLDTQPMDITWEMLKTVLAKKNDSSCNSLVAAMQQAIGGLLTNTHRRDGEHGYSEAPAAFMQGLKIRMPDDIALCGVHRKDLGQWTLWAADTPTLRSVGHSEAAMKAINGALPRNLFLFFQPHDTQGGVFPVEVTIKHEIGPFESRMLVLHREGEASWSDVRQYKATLKEKRFDFVRVRPVEKAALLATFHRKHMPENASITRSHMSILHETTDLRCMVHR